jgi:hypothetical protein
MLSNRSFVCVLAFCFVGVSLTGCRNRCNQPCVNPYQQPYANQYGYNAAPNYGQAYNGVAGRSPVIPPPATGTLNIPSIARNNPYGLNQNPGLLNTGQAAPTPANRAGQFNQQNGWRTSGSGTTNPVPNPAIRPATGTTLGSNSNSAAGSTNPTVAPANASSVLVQNTQSRTNQGYGDSYVRSPDYSTTAVNETLDRTRLPATDASAVRAPSQFYARASGAQVAQLPPQGTVNGQQPYYSGTFQTNPAFNVPQGGVIQPGAVFAANNVNRTAMVQDQSTATYDPYGNTRSADWRNRDTSGTFQ